MMIREHRVSKVRRSNLYPDTLCHFNPNHDSETGRFTTASGTFLKAGTRLNSVSSKYIDSDMYKNNGKWMYTYRDDESHDKKVYKGPFAKYLVMARGARFIREHKYVTVKDLKMPTPQQKIEEFKRLKTKDLIADLSSVQKRLVAAKVGNDKEQKEYASFDAKNIKTDEDWRIAYSIFSHAMEASWYYKSTKEYCEKMAKKYDAMVDDNNKGVYNRVVDPIIIFRANQALQAIKQESVEGWLSVEEIEKNYEDVRAELSKLGEKVKL